MRFPRKGKQHERTVRGRGRQDVRPALARRNERSNVRTGGRTSDATDVLGRGVRSR